MIRKLVVVLLTGVMCLIGVTSALAMTYNEAPMLQVKVAAGELPPVGERLPEEPLVVQPIEEIGQYGGTLRTLTLSPTSCDDIYFSFLALMLSMTPDLKTVVPSIAKGWEFSKDGKTLTLFLRKGMKWSDGVPFTADDIMFWYEDIILNDELTPVKPRSWSPGGELMKMAKIDDYTVKMYFAVPHPMATLHLAHYSGNTGLFFYPKHYLKQFHPHYIPIEKLEEMAKEKGFDQWFQFFQERSRYAHGVPIVNVDLPVVSTFMLKETRVGRLLLERNPYYWKVDTEGNQLPYIDRLLVTLVENPEIYTAKVVTGQVDYATMQVDIKNLPLYMENAEKSDYRVITWKSCYGADIYFQPNQTYQKDPILRDLFRDVRFRRALSLAIDREEINEVVYHGLATPRAYTVVPGCDYYEEEFEKAYAQFDLKEANRLLDEIGLKWDKKHEYRLRPDGNRLTWTIEYYPVWGPRTPVSELVKEYWRSVGINVFLKEISGELGQQRYPGNEVAMGNWVGCGATNTMFVLWPSWLWATHIGWEDTWCPEWSRWYQTKGGEGEEPPQIIKRLQHLYDEIQITMDDKKRIQIGKEALRIHAENVYSIGTVGLAPRLVIAKNNLRNIPEEKIYWDWDSLFGHYNHPGQFFFKQK